MNNLTLGNYLAGPQFQNQNQNKFQNMFMQKPQTANFPQPVAPTSTPTSWGSLPYMQNTANSGINLQNLFQNLFQKMQGSQTQWGTSPYMQNQNQAGQPTVPNLSGGSNQPIDLLPILQQLKAKFQNMPQPTVWPTTPTTPTIPNLSGGASQPVDLLPMLQQLKAKFQNMQQPTAWPTTPTAPNIGTGQPINIQPIIQQLLAKLLAGNTAG